MLSYSVILTLVIVELVVTALLQPDLTAGPVPAALTETLPLLPVVRHRAGPVAVAVAGAALQGAVEAVPAVGAEAGSVAAHPVSRTPGVAQLEVAVLPVPALVADTAPALTVAPGPAVQVTQLYTAPLPPVARLTDAAPGLDVPGPVVRAVRQTPSLLVVQLLAELPPPALPADTAAGDTEAVARTGRVHTVNWN